MVLLRKDATETAFKKESLQDFRILYLAVHGFADTQYPERSALVLGVDPKSGDNGLLQVREIIRRPLNSELTIRSACDTGVGKLQGQEGTSNLVEAFLVAGSKSVVASLWSADDTSASALMERFYKRLAQGESASLLAIGSAAGLVFGILSARVLAYIVYQASPRDPIVLAGFVLALATWIPARRALSVDPLILLREEVRSPKCRGEGVSSLVFEAKQQRL